MDSLDLRGAYGGPPKINDEMRRDIESAAGVSFSSDAWLQLTMLLSQYARAAQAHRQGVSRVAMVDLLQQQVRASQSLCATFRPQAGDDAVSGAALLIREEIDAIDDLHDQLHEFIARALDLKSEIQKTPDELKSEFEGRFFRRAYAIYLDAGGVPRFGEPSGSKSGSARFLRLLGGLLTTVEGRGSLVAADALRQAVNRAFANDQSDKGMV